MQHSRRLCAHLSCLRSFCRPLIALSALCTNTLRVHTSLSSSCYHASNCDILCHFFRILPCLLRSLEFDVVLQDHLSPLIIDFFLALSCLSLCFKLERFLFLLLRLYYLVLDLFIHRLLDQSSKGVLHRVSCRFEGAETSGLLGCSLLKLTLDLRFEHKLKETLLFRLDYRLRLSLFLLLLPLFLLLILFFFLSDIIFSQLR